MSVVENNEAAKPDLLKEDLLARIAFLMFMVPFSMMVAAFIGMMLLSPFPSNFTLLLFWLGVGCAPLFVIWFCTKYWGKGIARPDNGRPGLGLELGFLVFFLIARPLLGLMKSCAASLSGGEVLSGDRIVIYVTLVIAFVQFGAMILVVAGTKRRHIKWVVAILWLSEPIPYILTAIMFWALTPSGLAPGSVTEGDFYEILGALTVTLLAVSLWTVYLLRSVRVAARYSK